MQLLSNPNAIRTHSGKEMDVFALTPEMFCIEDVAYSLAKEPRFGGHLNDEGFYPDERNYSVLQHTIHVIEMVSKENKFAAINHENGEAYFRDLAKPIKLQISQYNEMEDKFLTMLAPIVGFTYPFPEEVHEVDVKLLLFEWHVFMLHTPPPDETVPPSQKKHHDKYGSYYILTKKQCRKRFLKLFNKLKGK